MNVFTLSRVSSFTAVFPVPVENALMSRVYALVVSTERPFSHRHTSSESLFGVTPFCQILFFVTSALELIVEDGNKGGKRTVRRKCEEGA